MSKQPRFETKIWLDQAQQGNPFVADASYCHGYDVFGELVNRAGYADYLLLLFTGAKPAPEESRLFEVLGIALANLGPRNASVRAAMNAGVGGAPAAASLISALAVGAGQTGGTREIYMLTQWFHELGLCVELWEKQLANPNAARLREDIWDEFSHTPGFDPHGTECSLRLLQLLSCLNKCGNFPVLKWLAEQRPVFEQQLGKPMSMTFISAAVYFQLGFSADQAEMCALLTSLPGAAVHALEAKNQGWRKFPFFGSSVELTDDPGQINTLPETGELPA